jgi:hypothetical protein
MPVVGIRLASDRRHLSRGARERSCASPPQTASMPPRSTPSRDGQTGDPDGIGALGQPDHDNHLVALRSLWKTRDEHRRECAAASSVPVETHPVGGPMQQDRWPRLRGHSGTLAHVTVLSPGLVVGRQLASAGLTGAGLDASGRRRRAHRVSAAPAARGFSAVAIYSKTSVRTGPYRRSREVVRSLGWDY